MKGRDIIDISPVLHSGTAVFPGDVSFSRKESLNVERGDPITLSSIESTVHVGAHADAPCHYAAGGASIAERDLALYYGACQVITVHVARGARILPEEIIAPPEAPRILFRTGTFPDPDHYSTDFASLSPELVDYLHEKNVCLVGIDTPSVDPSDSKTLESHAAIAKHDMAILEGVVLDEVADGLYTLCAFPLRLADCDASPVRAVLIR